MEQHRFCEIGEIIYSTENVHSWQQIYYLNLVLLIYCSTLMSKSTTGDRLVDSWLMSEALIMVDMFSSSPQERPAESVSKKKPSPQMVPCNISSARRQMSPGEGKLQGSLDRRKKRRGKKKKKKERKCHSFLWVILWTERADVIVSILLDRPN